MEVGDERHADGRHLLGSRAAQQPRRTTGLPPHFLGPQLQVGGRQVRLHRVRRLRTAVSVTMCVRD